MRYPAAMTDFAFLRAVNLGKHNKVPMKELMTLLDVRNLGPATFLLASGNLIFPQGAPDQISETLKQLIAEKFGVDTDAIMRNAADLRTLIDANPHGVPETGSVQISIWDGTADPDGLEELAAMGHGADRLTLVPGAAIIRYASSSHDSKLSNNLISRRLKVPTTLRNVKTFIRLLEKFG